MTTRPQLYASILIVVVGGVLMTSLLTGVANPNIGDHVMIAFPPTRLQTLENHSQLLAFLGTVLGIPESAWSPEQISRSSEYVCCLYDWRNHSLSGNPRIQVVSGSQPSATLSYTADGRLISIRILGPFGPPIEGGVTVETVSARLRIIAESFEISRLPIEQATWTGHGFVRINETTMYVPTLIAVLYSNHMGLPIAYGNEVKMTFDIEHSLATELVVYTWISAPSPWIPAPRAFTQALDYLNQTSPELTYSNGDIYFAFDFLNTSLVYQIEARYRNAGSGADYRVWVNAYSGRIRLVIVVYPPPGGTVVGFPPDPEIRPSHPSSSDPTLHAVGILASVLLLLALINVEPLTVAAFFLLTPLFLRLRKDTALDHFLRGQLYNHIVSTPGATFSEIRDTFSLSNGTTTYHLAVLEVLGYVRSASKGGRKYFLPTGLEKGTLGRTPSQLQEAILGVLRLRGVAAPSEVARSVGISRQRASYNLRKLVEHGLAAEDANSRGKYRPSTSPSP